MRLHAIPIVRPVSRAKREGDWWLADPNPDTASSIAAVVSAIGGVFAAIAAFRSAASAREANACVARSEQRFAVRELVVTANEVMIELRRAESRASDLKREHRSLAMFCGQMGGPRYAMAEKAVDEKLARAVAAAVDAKEFTRDTTTLYEASIDDINKRLAKMQQSLFEVRSIREDLEREFAPVESQVAVYREKAIQGPHRDRSE